MSAFPRLSNGVRSRANQPRRKASGTKFGFADVMDTTEDGVVESTELDLQSLADVADKVSREVELFAEQLDQFRGQLESGDRRAQIEGAITLVSEYREIAQSKYNDLLKANEEKAKADAADAWADSSGLVFRKSRSRRSLSDHNRKNTAEINESRRWKAEADTWALFKDVLTLAFGGPSKNVHNFKNHRFAADEPSITDFLKQNPQANQQMTVLRWLESIAENTGEDCDIIEDCLERTTERGRGLWSQGWIETKERIKGHKRIQVFDSADDLISAQIHSTTGSNLITQLDEDAQTRLQRSLEPADEVSERAVWAMIWEMLRRGKSPDVIRKWCEDKGQGAKAFAIGAYSPATTIASPASRLLWRTACSSLSSNGGSSDYERAVFGILGGDRLAASKACRTWADLAFVAHNVAVLEAYQDYLRASVNGQKWTFEPNHPINTNILDKAAETPFEVVQDSMLRGELSDLVVGQGLELSRQAQSYTGANLQRLVTRHIANAMMDKPSKRLIADDPHVLRILAHSSIILSHLGQKCGNDAASSIAAQNVIIGYMDYLMLLGKLTLLPLYASKLPAANAHPTLARALFHAQTEQQKNDICGLIESFNLDALAVLDMHYEYALIYSGLVDGNLPEYEGLHLLEATQDSLWPGFKIKRYETQAMEITEERIVSAIEWYMCLFKKPYWKQTFSALTHAAKQLLLHGRLAPLMELTSRMPAAEVSKLKTTMMLGDAIDVTGMDFSQDEEAASEHAPELASDVSSVSGDDAREAARAENLSNSDFRLVCAALQLTVREYHEIGQLVEAIRAVWYWRSAEAAAYKTMDDTAPKAIMEMQQAMSGLSKAMNPLLEQDFLTSSASVYDAYPSKKEGSNNNAELATIRHKYLPELVMAHISALHATALLESSGERLLEALELANSVVENERLLESFRRTSRTRELMDAIALCSKALLGLNEGGSGTLPKGNKLRQSGRTKRIWDISVS